MATADIVNTWFRERLANGPIARDTPAYNQLFEALPDLVSRLDAAAAPAPAPKVSKTTPASAPDPEPNPAA